MSDRWVPLWIQREDRTAFLACLGLGTLYAIRQGVWPPQAGIWTLGRPNIWLRLKDDPEIADDLVEVFSAGDELSAIQKLIPDKYDSILDDLISRLETVLASAGEQYWLATWSSPEPEGDARPEPKEDLHTGTPQ